jgi:hypothetical protein
MNSKELALYLIQQLYEIIQTTNVDENVVKNLSDCLVKITSKKSLCVSTKDTTYDSSLIVALGTIILLSKRNEL